MTTPGPAAAPGPTATPGPAAAPGPTGAPGPAAGSGPGNPPGAGRRASGMLSLRARLLVLLICVTAAFLLIMGAGSTIVLSRRLGGEFNSQLIAAAQHSPQQIASNPGDYVAVEITYLLVQVRPLTGNSAGTRELATTVENLISRHVARYYIGGQPFAVPPTTGPPTTGPPTTGPRTTGPRLRAVARLIPAWANGGYAGCWWSRGRSAPSPGRSAAS